MGVECGLNLVTGKLLVNILYSNQNGMIDLFYLVKSKIQLTKIRNANLDPIHGNAAAFKSTLLRIAIYFLHQRSSRAKRNIHSRPARQTIQT